MRLHVKSNTTGFLTVWMTDGTHEGMQLTPDGEWAGYWIATVVQIVAEFGDRLSNAFTVIEPGRARLSRTA